MSKRLYFGNIKEVIEPPNLIEIQLQSYFDFLQQDTPAAARKNIGLQGVLKEIFPIKSYDENIELDFVSYDIEQPKMSDYEAIRAGGNLQRRPSGHLQAQIRQRVQGRNGLYGRTPHDDQPRHLCH